MAKELAFEYEFTRRPHGSRLSSRLVRLGLGQALPPPDRWRGPVRVRVSGSARVSGVRTAGRPPGMPTVYAATGSWTAEPSNGSTTADGTPGGSGRLEAVVMRDFQLSEPILLGENGSFAAPCDGQLYLRCHDPWNQLSDNNGSIVVAFSNAH